MADPRNRRRRLGWTIGSVGLVVVLVGAGGVAYASVHAAQGAADYRTVAVATGDVEQSISLSGTVQRVNQVTATFPTSGIVTSVVVTVGERVVGGQRLATMGTGDLQASLLSAQASLAQGEAALATDEAPASSTASVSSTQAGSGAAAAASGSVSTAARSSAGGGSGSAAALASADAALAAVNRALDAENKVCGPVFSPSGTGSGKSTPTPTPSPTPSASQTPTPSASPSPTPTPTASAAATATATAQSSPDPSPTPTATESPSPHAAPAAQSNGTPKPGPTPGTGSTGTSGDASATPTPAQIQACVGALQKTAAALQQVRGAIQSIVAGLAKTATSAPASSASHTASTTFTSSSASRSAGGSGGSTASRIAADNVTILQDQNAVSQAQNDLDAAALTAPIAGVIGEIDLVPGQVASTSSGIVIVGDGAAAVTVDVPLADVPVLHSGEAAKVTPLGAVDAVDGVIQAVDLLPAASSGSSPAYPAIVLVADPTVALASGSSATVDIAVGSAQGVLRVPASAMSGRSGESAMVTVVAGGTATPTAVTLGVVGGGWAQVMSGLDAGQHVVLADASQPLPTNTTGGFGGGGFFRRPATSTGTTQGAGSGSSNGTGAGG